MLNAWYPTIQASLQAHDSLPAGQQPAYRTEQAREGNWELAATVAMRRYYAASSVVPKVVYAYREKANAEWTASISSVASRGESDLSDRARAFAEAMPVWSQAIVSRVIDEFVTSDMTAIRAVEEALGALRTAISLALIKQSTEYLRATTQAYAFPESREVFERVIPSLELNTIQTMAIAAASKALPSSEVVTFLLDLARDALEAINFKGKDYQIVLQDHFLALQAVAEDEMSTAYYTSRVSVVLGAVDTAIATLQDIRNSPGAFRGGLDQHKKQAKTKAGKKRKDILPKNFVEPDYFDTNWGLVQWGPNMAGDPKKVPSQD